jgi:hypothetical protein
VRFGLCFYLTHNNSFFVYRFLLTFYQHIPQHNGLVYFLVFGRIQKAKRFMFRLLAQLVERLFFIFQLFAVSAGKFIKTLLFVVEPFS